MLPVLMLHTAAAAWRDALCYEYLFFVLSFGGYLDFVVVLINSRSLSGGIIVFLAFY